MKTRGVMILVLNGKQITMSSQLKSEAGSTILPVFLVSVQPAFFSRPEEKNALEHLKEDTTVFGANSDIVGDVGLFFSFSGILY